MHILLLQMDLHFSDAHSLKEKRAILKPILNAIRRDFNVSAAEVDYHDVWQSARLAIVMVGVMKDSLERTERALEEFLSTQDQAELVAQAREWL